MELGNMIFGNSRGQYEVPREPGYEGPWERLCEALKLNWRGYADEGCLVPETKDWNGVENATFRVRAYDWDAECDCGAEDRMEAWFKAHPHSGDCYQTEYRARLKSWEDRSGYTAAKALAYGDNDSAPLGGMNATREEPEPGVVVMTFMPRSDAAMKQYRKLAQRRDRVDAKLRRELCERHHLSFPDASAVHCTCGRDARGDLFWENMGGHSEACRFVQPNFLYKPSGFRINWYKYPFRDSYMSAPLSPAEWGAVIDACIASAAPASQGDRGEAEGVLGASEASPGMNP